MYVFIVNPTSGKGEALAIWHKIESMLIRRELLYEAHISLSSETTRTYMNEKIASKSIKSFIVIGGDGTINSVIQQLVDTTIPLAILPAGSGNDVARNFNLVADRDHFIEKLISGKTITVDLLNVNGVYGMTIVGVGMDAKIGLRADRSIYKRWLNKINRGADAYTIAAIVELLTYKPFQGKLIVDGTPLLQTDLWLVANGNVQMYGGGLTICPYADPGDGIIDVTILHDAKRWKVLTRLFPFLLKGKPVIEKEVTYLKGKNIRIEGNCILPYIIDGEIFHSTTITISIRPNALNLVLTS